MAPHIEKDVNDDEEGVAVDTNFVPSLGLTSSEAAKRLLEHGRNELQDIKTPKVRPSIISLRYIFFKRQNLDYIRHYPL